MKRFYLRKILSLEKSEESRQMYVFIANTGSGQIQRVPVVHGEGFMIVKRSFIEKTYVQRFRR